MPFPICVSASQASDFPIAPYGSEEDRPYSVDRTMTGDFAALQAVLGNLRVGAGGDNPEAMIEGIYQSISGTGGPFINPSPGCTNLGVGYVCFRQRAQPVLVVISDAPTHNGPPQGGVTRNPYDPLNFVPLPLPHTYKQTIELLRGNLHARVIGINSGFGFADGARRLAEPCLGHGHHRRGQCPVGI